MASARAITAARRHCRVCTDNILYFSGVYPLSARFDQIFRASADRHIARIIDAGEITRVKIPFGVQGTRRGFEVALDHAGALDLQMPDDAALPRKYDSVRIGEPQIEPDRRPAGSSRLGCRHIRRGDGAQG